MMRKYGRQVSCRVANFFNGNVEPSHWYFARFPPLELGVGTELDLAFALLIHNDIVLTLYSLPPSPRIFQLCFVPTSSCYDFRPFRSALRSHSWSFVAVFLILWLCRVQCCCVHAFEIGTFLYCDTILPKRLTYLDAMPCRQAL